MQYTVFANAIYVQPTVFTPVVYITETVAAQYAIKKSSSIDSLPNQRDLWWLNTNQSLFLVI